jgi:choline-sulfatase
MRLTKPVALGRLVLFAVLVMAGVASYAQRKPDVFLITLDTVRADHLRCYGYAQIQTPALDQLCRDGVKFANAFTPSPITNTSHASIMTALYPTTHGVMDFGRPMPNTRKTWAELLKANGYQTAAFIGAVILDSRSLAPGLDRGFDYYDNFPPDSQAGAKGPRWGHVERRAMDVVSQAKKWLSAHRTGSRFVWLHLFDPHDPYEPPAPFDKQYVGRPYDGEIAYMDSALGDFLRFLKTNGWYEKSLIIAVGDHGEGLGEHKEETHGIFLYDSTLRIPLLLKFPGNANRTSVINLPVRTIDVLPTVLEGVGIKSADKFDGSSLTAYLNDRSTESRTLIAETDYPSRFGWAPLRAVRTDEFKFIEAPKPELYDLQHDPAEANNIYEPWKHVVQESRSLLVERRKNQPQLTSPGAVGQRTVAELRALGYLGPEGATNVPEPSLLPDPKDKIELQNLLHKAMMLSEDGQFAAARDALEKAVAMDPSSGAAFSQLGQLELQSKNYERAIRYLIRAREIRNDDSAAPHYLGQALAASGNFAGARDALESSLKNSPGQFETHKLLGQVYARLGDLKQAEDQLEAAVLLRPQDAECRLELAQILISANNFEKALQQLETANRLQPGNVEVMSLLQETRARLKKSPIKGPGPTKPARNKDAPQPRV